MSLQFGTKHRTKPKVLINIGACLDVPTSSINQGKKGESIINGGLGQVTAVVGAGNNYKSTILHYMMLSAADKIRHTTDTFMATYDTEVNISLDRLEKLAERFNYLPEHIITGHEALWAVTDKSQIAANVWVEELEEYAKQKESNKKLDIALTAFNDPYTNKELIVKNPTFVEVDSVTELESETVMKMLEGDLDDSSTNTYAMKQNLFKTKFFAKLPRLTNLSNMYVLMTAHIGEKINMDTSPMAKYQQPTKKLQYIKNGDTIKGVGPKFFFLTSNAWQAHTATVLKNQTTKLAEYPLSKDDQNETELNVVKLTQLRSKSGPSGYTIELVVSQFEGVLPSLTEFHHIKTNNKFGIEGSNTNYHLVLLPDVNLSRTTVRRKINENKKLRRALNITSELLQLHKFHPYLSSEELLCTPEELYKDIKELGYDWDMILDKTRGYWVPDQYNTSIEPFLSTIDLLNMRKGLYHPYFLDKDKKPLKQYKIFEEKD